MLFVGSDEKRKWEEQRAAVPPPPEEEYGNEKEEGTDSMPAFDKSKPAAGKIFVRAAALPAEKRACEEGRIVL